MNYPEAVRFLYSLGNEILTAKLGLSNIRTLLRFLENPHHRFPSILIAGTNGKGSVAAFCDSMLRCGGYRTGLYTSPHLCRIEERIRIVGVEIPQQDFADLTERVRNAVAILLSETNAGHPALRLERHPTYFEMVTAIAFLYFAECQVDLAILEVGLGGRFDATNVVDPLVAIITNVDYDHQQFLGNALNEIAVEKAGIIKPFLPENGVPTVFRKEARPHVLPVVYGGSNPVVDAVVEQQCVQAGACLFRVQSEMKYQIQSCRPGCYQIDLESESYGRLLLKLPLPGRHQVLNALTAVRCIEILRSFGFSMSREQVQLGIAHTLWPGRLEVIDSRPRLILDGAHNQAGAEAVRQYLGEVTSPDTTVMIFGIMRDKALQSIAQTLFPMARFVLLPQLESERACHPSQIVDALPGFASRLKVVPRVAEALDFSKQLIPEEGTIVVIGSLYLIGEVKEAINTNTGIRKKSLR